MSEKEKKAMRILDALSAVDEELLARSEIPGAADEEAAGKKKQSIYTFVIKHKRALTAACCFVALGGMFWAVSSVMFAPSGSAAVDMTSLSTLKEAAIDEAAMDETAMDEAALEENASEGCDASQEAASAACDTTPIPDTSVSNMIENDAEKLQGNQGSEMIADLTEAQARELTVLGGYIPSAIPKGYGFESARYGALLEQESLFISWTKGLDYIELSIENVSPEMVTLTDINKTESYDVQQYEIPYADSVPREYRDSFDNPVFLSTELSEELIGRRMKVVSDAGDTDTPRGNFAIYYREAGILVSFRGRGTPSEIMDMFDSLNP